MANRGVVIVAYGEKAKAEAREAVESVRCHNPGLPVRVVGEPVKGVQCISFPRADTGGRFAKLNLDSLSPFPSTLYLDADCRIQGDLSAGFQALDDGFDLALSYSSRQGADVMGHAPMQDRQLTWDALGFREVLGLQAGVMFVAWNERTRLLWAVWREEWERGGRYLDQPALLRALARVPVYTWILGKDWNGGSLVSHLFGRAR